MTKGRKLALAGLSIPFLALSALLLSLYPSIAEDVPAMRPFGWIELPEQRPYAEGEVAIGYREAADRARAVLQDHVRTIGVPAFSAAVAVDGRLVWSAAVGHAQVEQLRKATPSTLFRIGSTSKAVTGTLFARMVDGGLVNVEAPISTHVEDLPN